MRTRRRRLLCLLALALCSACAPEPEIDTRTLQLHALPSCEVSAERIEITALGDFPPRDERIDVDEVKALTDFPLGTRELSFLARDADLQWLALAPVQEGAAGARSWLLPARGVCPLGDPLAVALDGAAVAALPDGGFLVAGGRSGDDVVSTAFVLRAGAQLADVVPDGLLLRRSGASATALGGVVIVAGGAADDSGSAQDTFEVYAPELGSFDRDRSRKLQGGSRMSHGAAALDDSTLLLVGGRAENAGAALSSVESIDLAIGEGALLDGAAGLAIPRVRPSVLVLDDGQVLIAAGSDASGRALTTVERFVVDEERIEPVDVTLPARAELQVAALPGARVGFVACGDGKPCEAGVLLGDEDGEWRRVDAVIDLAARLPNGLTELRVQALSDGKLLVTGRDPEAVIDARALVLDLGRGTVESRAASGVPTHLVSMRDGAVAELGPLGAALRREQLGSAYGPSAGNLVLAGAPLLALDVASHWQVRAATLQAVQEGARADLAGLRFADVRVRLVASGGVALRFHDGRGQAVTVQRRGGRIDADGCSVSLDDAVELVAERVGTQLRLSADGRAQACSVSMPRGTLGIALIADAETSLTKLTVERL